MKMREPGCYIELLIMKLRSIIEGNFLRAFPAKETCNDQVYLNSDKSGILM